MDKKMFNNVQNVQSNSNSHGLKNIVKLSKAHGERLHDDI